MLRIRVLSQMGRPLVVPLSADFEAAGGTIGRAPDNTLVLPSPGKHISRRQAQIVATGDGFSVVSTGSSTPLILNGVELPANRPARIGPGDRMLVAEYELLIESAQGGTVGPQAASPASRRFGASIPEDFDPFAAPPSPATRSVAGPQEAPAPRSSPAPAVPAAFDPLDPFAAPPTRAADPMLPRPSAGDPLGIGGDYASSLDPGRRAGESIDALFKLGPEAASDPLAIGAPLGDRLPSQAPETSLDPLAPYTGRATAVGAPVPDHLPELHGSMRLPEAIPPTTFGLAPGSRSAASPVSIGAPPASVPAPAGDRRDGPVLSWSTVTDAHAAPSNTPPATPAPPAASPTALPTIPAPDLAGSPPSYLPDDMVRSIAERTADSHRADFAAVPKTRPTELLDRLNNEQLQALASTVGTRVARAARHVVDRPAAGVVAHDPPPGSAADDPFAPAAPRPASPSGEQVSRAAPPQSDLLAALTREFLAGAGLAELPRVPGQSEASMLTPETMRRLGELMRLVAQGTVDLLAARATLKHEMRADVTRISASDNNPLKFATDSRAALAHLLSAAPVPGFMAPAPALDDAYRDLLAHQIAFVAGVREAMHGLIARFDPQQLEARLTRKAVIDSVLPNGRRARLWELFVELYGEISREAEDDFDALFGRAFVDAYEAQSARLRER